MQKLNKNIIKNLKINKYLELLPDFKEERTRKFTTLVLTILALSFFGLFAINPTLSTIAKLKKEIEDNTFVHEQLQQKINNLSILQQKYITLQNDLPAVYATIPQKSEIPSLVGQIQSLAKTNNLSVSTLQTFEVEISDSTKKQNKYTSFSFAISGNGTYEDISKFVSDLVKMQRIITLENLSITKKTSESNLLQLSLRGSSYFKP